MVAVAVGVSVTVAVGVLVGVAVPNGTRRIATASMAKAFVDGAADHDIGTLPEQPDLLPPMPVMLLLPMFTCTFHRLLCPPVGAATTGPATETTSCTTSVPPRRRA